MTDAEVTRYLAIWGAVTGTIGTLAGLVVLYFRFRHYLSDRAILKCSSTFKFSLSWHKADPDFKIIMRSLGRRPVWPQTIEYCVEPSGWGNWLRRRYLWSKGQSVIKQDLTFKTALEDGAKADVRMAIASRDLVNVRQCRVVDGTGKRWPVKWRSQRELRETATYESLGAWKAEKDDANNHCEVFAFRAGRTYYINVSWGVFAAKIVGGDNRGESLTGRRKCTWVKTNKREDFDKELKDIVEVQKPLINARKPNRIYKEVSEGVKEAEPSSGDSL